MALVLHGRRASRRIGGERPFCADCGSARAASPEAKDALLISIQTGMLVALGFLVASLLGLLLASAFWSRAVRLTTKRLKRSMPVSEAEIKADRDRLRAEHAIKVHKLETSWTRPSSSAPAS